MSSGPGGGGGPLDIHAEIRDRFGVLPNFFKLTSATPEITTNLWGFARFAYLDSPLPSLFKERLFVYLSRFCEVRYCISRHVGFLNGLGRPAGDAQSPIQTAEEIVRLVRRPLPRDEPIQQYASRCAACDQPLAEMPEPDSAMEEAIFACATHAFLQTPQAPECLMGLRRALGNRLFEHLLVFLAFVRTAHYWTKVHSELDIEQDVKDLLATHEALAECVLNDPEQHPSNVGRQLIDELALLREAKRRLSVESRQNYEQAQLSRHQADVAHSDLAMLFGLTDALNRSDSLEHALDIALDGISRVLQVDRSSILLHDSDRIMRFVAWRGLSDEYRKAVDGHSPWPADAEDPAALYIEDVDADPAMAAYLPLFRSESIRALAFVPLVTSGVLRGKFMIYSRTPRVFTERERHLAGSVATQLAFFIERRRAEQERHTAREALVANLERTVAFSELFVGVLSHDLRNPLSAIQNSARLLSARDDTPNALKTSQRILSSTDRIARMITQLLDFTRARIGNGIPLSPTRFDLMSTCTSVVEELEAGRPDVKITVEQLGDTAGTWDRDRLAQVFSNIVANAVDHGVNGSALIRLDGTAADAVAVEVLNGGAIPAERLATIFDPFWSAARTDLREGLGLGLYIADQIVRAHGGSIRASTGDATTCFHIVIPRNAPSAARVFADSAASSR
jgi:signal transduction histidine kinase